MAWYSSGGGGLTNPLTSDLDVNNNNLINVNEIGGFGSDPVTMTSDLDVNGNNITDIQTLTTTTLAVPVNFGSGGSSINSLGGVVVGSADCQLNTDGSAIFAAGTIQINSSGEYQSGASQPFNLTGISTITTSTIIDPAVQTAINALCAVFNITTA